MFENILTYVTEIIIFVRAENIVTQFKTEY